MPFLLKRIETNMAMDGDDIHLFHLDGYNDFENSSDESEGNDSIEVVSNVDEEENNIVDMTSNLVFSSDDEFQNNDGGADKDNCIDIITEEVVARQQKQRSQLTSTQLKINNI
jgi:hypothetical protein